MGEVTGGEVFTSGGVRGIDELKTESGTGRVQYLQYIKDNAGSTYDKPALLAFERICHQASYI